ncbi:SDR family NAD(P)-dependent oxidoreductase, partial [Planococcus sp. SIMBA_143]
MFVNKKVAVITGAASGIGKELARVFAENGAKVALSDLDEDKVKRAAAELKEKGMDTIGIRCDVTKEN